MERKIICFIKNEMNQKGIFHCFRHGGNILDADINPFCNSFLYEEFEEGDKILNIILGKEGGKNYLFISSQGVELVSTFADRPTEWDMLWVHDSVSMADVFKDCPPEALKDSLILYHRQPDDAEKTLTENVGKYKFAIRSLHEPFGKYVLLYEIARIWKSDNSFDKKEYEAVFRKISNELFNAKLEAVLKFLHICLNKAPEQKDYDELLAEANIKSQSDLPALYGNLLDVEYVESLTVLRDHLFEKVSHFG